MNQRANNMAEVLRRVIEHRLSELHTLLPGRVEAYDAATQTARVSVAVKNTIETENGEETITFPVIDNVPVAHPRAGAWFVHLPLSAGDYVALHFGERSLDQFRMLGAGQAVLDVRKHNLSDAVAYPVNLYPDASALAGVSDDTLSFGRAGGSTVHVKTDGTVNIGSETPADAIATANKVAAQLSALKTAFATDIATAVAAGGLFFGAALTTLFATWPGDVASTKGKVDP